MSMLNAEHRARRRRVEGSLLLSLMLVLTVAGAVLYIAKFAAIVGEAGALFASIR